MFCIDFMFDGFWISTYGYPGYYNKNETGATEQLGMKRRRTGPWVIQVPNISKMDGVSNEMSEENSIRKRSFNEFLGAGTSLDQQFFTSGLNNEL